jgi:fumarate hydratase class II
MVEKSLMMCTSLAPVIGYEKAADVAKSAFKENKTVREYCLEHGILDEQQLTELLDPTEMTHPGGN